MPSYSKPQAEVSLSNISYASALVMLDGYNISDVDNHEDLKLLFPNQDPRPLIAARKDPRRYLSRLTAYSNSFLATMYMTGSSLVGDRATEFFVPGTCSDDADWYIFNSGGPHMVNTLVARLKQIDFRMTSQLVTMYVKTSDGRTQYYQTMSATSTARGVENSVKIVIYPAKDDLEMVTAMCSSAQQSIITGYGAICLQYGIMTQGYYFMTSKDTTSKIEYSVYDMSNYKDSISEELIELPYADICNSYVVSPNEYPYTTRYRCLTDKLSYVVNYENMGYLAGRFGRDTSNMLNELCKIGWSETSDGMMSVTDITRSMADPATAPYSMYFSILKDWMAIGVCSVEKHRSSYTIKAGSFMDECIAIGYRRCAHTEAEDRMINWLVIRNNKLDQNGYSPDMLELNNEMNADIKAIVTLVLHYPGRLEDIEEAGLTSLYKAMKRVCKKCREASVAIADADYGTTQLY